MGPFWLICPKISLIFEQLLRLFQLRPQMNRWTIKETIEQQSVILTRFAKENTLGINAKSYNYHFSMNGDWFIVSPIIVSMVTSLKLKNAISQLLIKLETCCFCVHICISSCPWYYEMKTRPKNRHNPSTPTVNTHMVQNAHLLPTVYLLACSFVNLPRIVPRFAKSLNYL